MESTELYARAIGIETPWRVREVEMEMEGKKIIVRLEVDLEKVYSIDRVTVVTYYDGGRYYRYTVEASTEGKTWATVVDMSKNTKPSVKGGQEHAFARTAARYVRVKASNMKTCPSWHNGAGGPAWIFADEVVVE